MCMFLWAHTTDLGGSMPGACFMGMRLWIPAQILVCAPLLHQPRSACPVPSAGTVLVSLGVGARIPIPGVLNITR